MCHLSVSELGVQDEEALAYHRKSMVKKDRNVRQQRGANDITGDSPNQKNTSVWEHVYH